MRTAERAVDAGVVAVAHGQPDVTVLARRGDAMFSTAMELNLTNIEETLRAMPAGGRLLDLGCDDGARTVTFAAAARANEAHGIEVSGDAAERARRRGVAVTQADLGARLPLEDAMFDVVVSNQVLEHLADTDLFVAEIWRVLRPGGLAIVSTENLASWHNIAALVLGWQPFSLANVTSRRSGLGNPLSLHRHGDVAPRSWQHVKAFSYRGLRELFEVHGLRVDEVHGAGYYPLPARFGRFEPRHAAFLTVVATRPR